MSAVRDARATPWDEPTRDIRTLAEAAALLDEWIAAYRELRSEYLRTHERCWKAEADLKSAEFLLRHLDPFLPPWLQDSKAREAEPAIYAALANAPAPPRRSKFDEPEPCKQP